MNTISVIIPTYLEPDVLDICLESAIKNQKNQNEIIVVVDGFYEFNKNVLNKHKQSIEILDLQQNVGLAKATNLGVYNASNELILIVNDDNIFPQDWDEKLLINYYRNSCISPNQIEPYASMFKQFIIKDFGRAPETFRMQEFLEFEQTISKNIIDNTGSTLPIFISKVNYLKVGGWDESYPGQSVCDWEFFMKCELAGIRMLRTYNCTFYHFVSLATHTPDKIQEIQHNEQLCHQYFQYKWGVPSYHNPENNSKVPPSIWKASKYSPYL